MVAMLREEKYAIKVFLENKRRKGENSVFGVATALAEEFGLSMSDANDELFDWIKTYNQDDYRICNTCGEAMFMGFCIGDGDEYYCTETCLHEEYTEEQYEELYEAECAYFTERYD